MRLWLQSYGKDAKYASESVFFFPVRLRNGSSVLPHVAQKICAAADKILPVAIIF